MEVLKVSSKSNPNACAGALAGVLRQDGAVEVQVVGAGALNQAVKAVAIARGFVAPSGIDLVCIPTFADIEIDGENRTAIRLLLEDRHRRQPIAVDVRTGGMAVEFDGATAGAGAAATAAAGLNALDGAAAFDGTPVANGDGAASPAIAPPTAAAPVPPATPVTSA